MAPPSRLRPHLNDLLQKNLELEHIVADLRHQLTQSAAKWADERKLLAMECDTLMASFAKFRARLDTHPSDWGDSEGEVERNLDAGGQGEESGEAIFGVPLDGQTEVDQGSTVEDSLRERCNVLATELHMKEEELEQSQRKHEAAEVQLRVSYQPSRVRTLNKFSRKNYNEFSDRWKLSANSFGRPLLPPRQIPITIRALQNLYPMMPLNKPTLPSPSPSSRAR